MFAEACTQEAVHAQADPEFLAQYMGLVRSIVSRLRAELDLRSAQDDLEAYGIEGLLQARKRYDATRGIQFSTFAYYRIRGAVLDGVREMALRGRRSRAKHLASVATDAITESLAEDRLARARAGTTGPQESGEPAPSAQAIAQAVEQITAGFMLAALDAERADKTEATARMRGLVDALPERERALGRGLYFEGRKLVDVAADINASTSWASRMHTQILAKLRAAMSED